MHPFFALILLVSCEACDELAKAGAAHLFAIDAAWRPKCEGMEARFVAADPWPQAGEVRRDAFTRDCAEVSLTRAFVAAPELKPAFASGARSHGEGARDRLSRPGRGGRA